jgi:hypothetical protein
MLKQKRKKSLSIKILKEKKEYFNLVNLIYKEVDLILNNLFFK